MTLSTRFKDTLNSATPLFKVSTAKHYSTKAKELAIKATNYAKENPDTIFNAVIAIALLDIAEDTFD